MSLIVDWKYKVVEELDIVIFDFLVEVVFIKLNDYFFMFYNVMIYFFIRLFIKGVIWY